MIAVWLEPYTALGVEKCIHPGRPVGARSEPFYAAYCHSQRHAKRQESRLGTLDNRIDPLTSPRGVCSMVGMDTPLSEKMLRDAQRAFERADAKAAERRALRDALVAAAIDAGWSQTRIAEATGLTRGRVGQLASRSKGTPS